MEDSEFLWTADLGDESFLTTSMDNSGYAPVMSNEYEDQSNNIGQQMYIQNGTYQLSTGYNVNTAQTQGMMSNLPIGYTTDYNQHAYVQTQGMGVPVNNIQNVELPILPIPGYTEAEPVMMDAPLERPPDLYPEDTDAALVHLSAIKDTFDKLLRDIEPEKLHPFGDFNLHHLSEQFEGHLKSLGNITEQYSNWIAISDPTLFSRCLTATRDFHKTETQLKKVKNSIEECLNLASKRYPRVLDNIVGFLQSVATELGPAWSSYYSPEESKVDLWPSSENAAGFGLQVNIPSDQPPLVYIVREEVSYHAALSRLLSIGEYSEFWARIKELNEFDSISRRFGNSHQQKVATEILPNLREWLRSQTFAFDYTEDHTGDIITYYITRNSEAPSSASGPTDKGKEPASSTPRKGTSYTNDDETSEITTNASRFALKIAFEVSPFFLPSSTSTGGIATEGTLGTQGGLNTDLLGSSAMDGVDVTQNQIQPPVEHKPHKVVQLQPSVPLVTSSLRHLVGIIMPEYHDKTSFKSYITAPTFVEDLLVGNKNGEAIQDTVNVFNETHRYFHCESKTPGVVVKRIPFDAPEHLTTIVLFLRQQLVFNELFLSCFGRTKPQSTIPSRGEGRQIVKAMEVRTEAPQSISVTGWFGSGLFKMDVRIREDGSLEAKLLSPSATLSSLDNYVSKVISVCHSIPLTMYNIFAKLTQLQQQQQQR